MFLLLLQPSSAKNIHVCYTLKDVTLFIVYYERVEAMKT